MIKQKNMIDFYKTLSKNKNDLKYIEKITGRQIASIKSLLEDEENLDMIIENIAPNISLPKNKGRLSTKLLIKLIIMHHAIDNSLTSWDKSYLAKIVGYYFNQKKLSELYSEVLDPPFNEHTARIHLSYFVMYPDEYLAVLNEDRQTCIRNIKRSFASNPKTRNISENIEIVIKLLVTVKRTQLFEKIYVSK